MITLGYWGVRGRGHVLRLLLEYTGASWQETTYTSDTWFGRDKFSLGLPFPNLPYLIDGDVKLTETAAIARYIIQRSEKQELLGRGIKDRAMVNNLVGVISDCNDAFASILYQKDGLSQREEKWGRIEPKLQALLKFKGQKKWMMPYLSWPDFTLSELSNYIQNVYPQHYPTFAAFQQLRTDFEALPEIKHYYSRQGTFKGKFAAKPNANLEF